MAALLEAKQEEEIWRWKLRNEEQRSKKRKKNNSKAICTTYFAPEYLCEIKLACVRDDSEFGRQLQRLVMSQRGEANGNSFSHFWIPPSQKIPATVYCMSTVTSHPVAFGSGFRYTEKRTTACISRFARYGDQCDVAQATKVIMVSC